MVCPSGIRLNKGESKQAMRYDSVIDSVVMAWCYALELAIRKGLPIATQDRAILRAAKSIQIEIVNHHAQ